MEYDLAVNTCPEPAGILVVIGGKEDKGDKKEEKNKTREEILKKFIELIEKDDPCIEVITSGSGKPEEMFEDYRKVFEGLAIKDIGHISHKERKEVITDDLTERINKADAFFFTGGDQLKLTSLYGGSKFLTRLKERYIHERIIIGGTSAGAMALSTPMIYAGSKEEQDITGAIKITMGLEFLKDVCIDTHFIDRDRFVRMAQVIATNPTCIGLGIEEDTAIIIRKGSEAEIIGSSIVTVIEGFEISSSTITDFNKEQKLSLRDLRVHLLAKGSKYHISQMNPPHK
jgi:cyanophycinase